MKQIKEVMTTPALSCEKNETIQSVVTKMHDSNIGFLPVVDENKKVIGTITDRDVFLAIGNAGKPIQERKVHEVMKGNAHTIKQDDDATTALRIMRTKQIGRLPVVDNENHLKGVVSLMGIALRIKDSKEKVELGHDGTENVINTLQSIGERNRSESVEEMAEE